MYVYVSTYQRATRMLRRVAYEAAAGTSRRRCRSLVRQQQVEVRFLSIAATPCACSTSSSSSQRLLTPSSSASHLSSQHRQYHVAAAASVTNSLTSRRGGLIADSPLFVVGPHAVPTVARRHAQRRHMADNLLGHSPMARSDPRPKATLDGTTTKPLIGTDSNTAGGGVWAQTSAKRDKLAELKLEISPDLRTLDDMASPVQRLDLDMTDGLRLVARAVDGAWGDQHQRQEEEVGGGDEEEGGEEEEVDVDEETMIDQEVEAGKEFISYCLPQENGGIWFRGHNLVLHYTK